MCVCGGGGEGPTKKKNSDFSLCFFSSSTQKTLKGFLVFACADI